jgi:c-di-AMP phosphodiesterase-like protein
MKNPDFKDLFIDIPTALEHIDSKTLLIIVDVHNKEILESKELYDKAKTVVVIDHHRKVVNYIDNAVIFHHEPFASSASEMITEIVQYMDNASRLPNCCADALLAGITLDTKNFVMRTGSRTFEAAAYLRKIGADTVAVRRLFSSSIENYKRKMNFISSAEIYEKYAIASVTDNFEDIRLVAPQAADELLNVSGVEASFVIFKSSDSVSISARSLGSFNVQIIMEKLGGGGHQNMAAAQLKNATINEAKELLLRTLNEI